MITNATMAIPKAMLANSMIFCEITAVGKASPKFQLQHVIGAMAI